MNLPIESLVRRHMKGTSGFVLASDGAWCPFTLALEAPERLLGWSSNPEPWCNSFVAYTDAALWIVSPTNSVRVPWGDITDFEMPSSKEDAKSIGIHTPTGSYAVLLAGRYGEGGKYADLYSLTMLLNVICWHNRTSRPGTQAPDHRRR